MTMDEMKTLFRENLNTGDDGWKSKVQKYSTLVRTK